MAKKINFTKNIMEQVNNAVRAVQKDAQVSILVSKNKAKNAPADKLVCCISCVNPEKEAVELAFNVDTPKDFQDDDAPYLALTVNADAFTQQIGAMLLRDGDIALTEEKSAIKLSCGTAVSKVPMVEESETIKAVRAEVVYKNDETQLKATLSSKKVKSAVERCLTAVNPSSMSEMAKNLTCCADGGALHFYGFDSVVVQHAVVNPEDNTTLSDTKEGGSSFAITSAIAKTLCSLTNGGKNFLFFVSPTKGCIGVRPAENMTLRYTFPLASARLSDAIIAQVGKMETDNCFAKVVVDGEKIRGAVKFVSASVKDVKSPVKISISPKSLTLTQADAKVAVDIVEQEGSEQAEKLLDISRLNTILAHEGNGNVLISITEKGQVSVRGGDLTNCSTSVALLAPVMPKVKKQEETEEE